jgi:hypothetical protein
MDGERKSPLAAKQGAEIIIAEVEGREDRRKNPG